MNTGSAGLQAPVRKLACPRSAESPGRHVVLDLSHVVDRDDRRVVGTGDPGGRGDLIEHGVEITTLSRYEEA